MGSISSAVSRMGNDRVEVASRVIGACGLTLRHAPRCEDGMKSMREVGFAESRQSPVWRKRGAYIAIEREDENEGRGERGT